MSARKRGAAAAADSEEVVLDDSDGEDAPVARRARLAPDYPRGSVLKIVMEDFMTYTFVEVEPGPRLNLILGPNGTGKSSMVCALCVGLAGSTKLLGRAKEMKDYVKRGESSGSVTITLSSGNPARPTVVSRKITTDNKSEWKLNGTVTTASKVAEAVAALNIQLDNLCQFLPQDRVVAFAQMSPTELLVETEKAFGARELHEQHMALINAKQGMRDLEAEVAATAASLERLKGINAGMERDVERFQARAALLAKADGMKLKLPWLKYEAARAAHEESRDKLQAGKKSLAEKEAEQEKHSGPLKAKLAAEKTATEALTEATKRAAAADKEHRTLHGKSEEITEELEKLDLDKDAVRKRAAKHAAQLAKLERDVEAARADVDSLPPPAARGAELDDIKAQLKQCTTELRRCESEVADAVDALRIPQAEASAAADKLAQLDNLRHQRIEAMRQARPGPNRGLATAADIVAKMKAEGQFKSDVYGPLLCEVAVTQKLHAGYLEQQVPQSFWSMFVTRCDEDRNALLAATKSLNVSCQNYTGSLDGVGGAPVPAELTKLGVTGTLDTVFDAPPLVKAALNDAGGLTRAYIGGAEAEKNTDAIMRVPNVNILWTPSNQYVGSGSKYDSTARYVRIVPARPPKLFSSNANPAIRAELTQRLKAANAQLKQLKDNGTALERARNDAGARVDELNKRRDALQREETQMLNRRRSVMKLLEMKQKQLAEEKAAPDPAAELARLDADVAKHQKRAVAVQLKSNAAMVALVAAIAERAPLALAAAELREQARVCKVLLDQHGADVVTARKLVASLADIVASDRARAKQLHADAEKVTGPLDDERLKAFEELPSDANELEDLIAATTAEADAIMCPNPGVMQEYKARAAEIVTQERAHRDKAEELAGHQEKVDATKAAWLPRLRELFGRVSTAFSTALAGIGCAGEVRLAEEGDDFASYAVHILVKFRANEQLRQLTATYQSGGERSVTTMMYLIALQDLTRCPFRVVDEINQGMDPKNERKIFEQMVASACAPGTPQCFLLTPKLLPQLVYSKEVTVLAIYNGPWTKEVARNWSRELLLGAPVAVC